MSFMEEFLNYKSYFEELQNHVVNFESLKRYFANVSVNSVSMRSKDRQSDNESNKKDGCQVNPYDKSETNKIA